MCIARHCATRQKVFALETAALYFWSYCLFTEKPLRGALFSGFSDIVNDWYVYSVIFQANVKVSSTENGIIFGNIGEYIIYIGKTNEAVRL